MYYASTQIENVFKIDAKELLSKLNSNYFNEDISNLSISKTNHVQLKQILNLINEKGLSDKIKKLDLGFNMLKELPAEIGNLPNLKDLDLRFNRIIVLPDSIGNLSSLTRLMLLQNMLTALPDSIGNLSSLNNLDLRNNLLTALPAEIGKLARLTVLDLKSNQLTALPAEIGKLASLNKLDLESNQLTALPAEIGNLASLTSLNILYNQFPKAEYRTNFPFCICSLPNIHEYLRTIPFSIGNLTNISVINFQKIDVTNWQPRELWLKLNALMSLTKNLLTKYLNSNGASAVVVSYICYDVSVCKLSGELQQESEEILKNLESNPVHGTHLSTPSAENRVVTAQITLCSQ